MSTAPIRTVLFDLDGTLIDHFRTIYRCYCHSLEQLGLEPVSYEKVRATVGGGIRVTFSRLVPAAYVDRGVALWMERFEEIWHEGIEILEGVESLLAQLHTAGIQTAIYTNKEGTTARRIAERLGWHHTLSNSFGRLDTAWCKPAPELTSWVLEKLGADPASTIMIGDSPFDLETARRGQLRGYAVATGSHSEAQLREEPHDGVFPHLPALATAVFGWKLD